VSARPGGLLTCEPSSISNWLVISKANIRRVLVQNRAVLINGINGRRAAAARRAMAGRVTRRQAALMGHEQDERETAESQDAQGSKRQRAEAGG
jgi:hypothetical protein